MNKNKQAFESYQKQAVEDILHRRISAETFQYARAIADKAPAHSMQHRIELIAKEAR
jgi:hypothetical protein